MKTCKQCGNLIKGFQVPNNKHNVKQVLERHPRIAVCFNVLADFCSGECAKKHWDEITALVESWPRVQPDQPTGEHE